MTKFVTFGETMTQYNATYVGPFRQDGTYLRDCGGAESNVAADLHKLSPDIDAMWVSRLGDDDEGRFILDELAGRVRIEAELHPGERTGTAYANHLEDGQHPKRYQRKGSAASRLTFDDVRPHIDGADVLHVTGITPVLSQTCRETVFESLDYALASGVPVSFDANYREPLWDPADARYVFDKMIEYSTVFKVGHDEAETVWAKGWSAEHYSKHFHEANKALVVVTRAEEGAIAFDGHQLISHPGYHIELVDPIGAGDAFMAGFLAGIFAEGTVSEFFDLDAPARAHVLKKCLEVANVCGALVCTRHGDTAAMPTMPEVRTFQQDYLPD